MKNVNVHKTCCKKLTAGFKNGTKLSLNPNCTGQGQSRPPKFWCQIPNKIPVSDFKIKKYLFLQKCPLNIFELQTRHQKMMFLLPFLCIVKIPAAALPCWPPLFCLVLMLLQTTWGAGEVSQGCGPQSSAAPVNIPVSFWSWAAQSSWGGGFSVGPALLLFLSEQLEPHRSWQIPKTVCSITRLANTGESKFRPGECEVKTERTPVLDSLPRPMFNYG
jgi:hypothetical protein